MNLQGLITLCLFLTIQESAATEDLISPWSTEPLSWSTPDNVTVIKFDSSNKLTFPAQFSMMLWVYSKPECSAVDSDEGRPRWWAEIRRHVPDESALSVATIAVENLPKGISTASLGLDKRHCSSIAFIPSGYDLSKDSMKIAPQDDSGMKKFIGWVSGIMRVSCIVRNPFNYPVALYWVDDSTDERQLLEMPAKGESPQHTFIGHNFVARRASDEKLLDWWSMDGGDHVIEDKASVFETSCQAAVQKSSGEKTGLAGNTGGCADAATALFNWLYDSSMSKRYALNTVQPYIVHNYTDLGFKVMSLPPGTHKWLKEWYEKNADAEIEEGSAGAVGTQHLAPWYVRHITWQMKQKLISEVRPYLAEWSGFPEETLEMTSIYGIRRYSRGSVLRMHVDTCMTHVVSAIVNVEQIGMDEDWPLEVMGNDGLYHYVTMKPGEMLFYESAKALHGRPAPLKGDGYSNVFIHFKPTTEGVWDYGWY